MKKPIIEIEKGAAMNPTSQIKVSNDSIDELGDSTTYPLSEFGSDMVAKVPFGVPSGSLIYKKLAEVMKDVQPIAKGHKNPQQGYKFRGIDDVYAMIQPILAKHEVFLSLEVLKTSREERQTKSGGILTYVEATVKYQFVTTDGSYFESVVVGEAMDSGDKGTNKALSAAQKYLFLQTFCIPTDLAEDSEKDSPEPAPRAQGTISDAQAKRMFAISKSAGWSNEQLKALIGEFGYDSTKDVKWGDYETICERIK